MAAAESCNTRSLFSRMLKLTGLPSERCLVLLVSAGIKLGLFIVCRRVAIPGSQALAHDHRNDVISNTAAIACGLIGMKHGH